MSNSDDPYDRKAVLDKLAEHAWNHTKPNGDLKHRQDFIDRGIKSQADLRNAVERGLESKDTLAFRTRPDPQKSQTVSREFYEIKLADKNNEPFKMIVIVNPGLDKRGDLSGGTCYIPDDSKQIQAELQIEKERSHNRTVQWEPHLVIGGRPALREHEQQLAERQTQREETLFEKIDRHRREKGQLEINALLRTPAREKEQDRELDQERDL